MKPMNIMNKLNESVTEEQLNVLPEWAMEKLVNEDSVTLYYCPECNVFFKDSNKTKTNMESLYGVGDEFQNSTYEDLNLCPYCSDSLIEKTIDAEDVVDLFYNNSKLSDMLYAKLSQDHPDVEGELYRKAGTHHADPFEEYPELAWDIIKEILSEGKL